MATVGGTKISVSTLQHVKSVVITIQSFSIQPHGLCGVTTAKPMYTINAGSTIYHNKQVLHMWIICPIQRLLSHTSTSSINFGLTVYYDSKQPVISTLYSQISTF